MRHKLFPIVAFVLYVLALLVVGLHAQSKEPPRMLRTEGNLAIGPVSVFFGRTYFGQLVCQETWTEPTVVFSSSVSRPNADFAMNVEFLREIVHISDVEYAKAPCKKVIQ